MSGMHRPGVVEQLSAVPMFGGISKKGLRDIAAMAREMTFDAGEAITVEATRGARFHLLLDGRAEVKIGGRRRAMLEPGDTVGEMALLDGGARTATVLAVEPVRTLSLASWNFRTLLRQQPLVMEKVLMQMVARLREVDRSLAG